MASETYRATATDDAQDATLYETHARAGDYLAQQLDIEDRDFVLEYVTGLGGTIERTVTYTVTLPHGREPVTVLLSREEAMAISEVAYAPFSRQIGDPLTTGIVSVVHALRAYDEQLTTKGTH